LDDVIDDPSHPATNATASGAGNSWTNDAERGIVFRTVQDARLSCGTQGITGDFTWSLWIRMLGDNSGTIMGTRAASGGYWNRLTPGGMSTWATTSATNGGWSLPLNEGVWHHLAVRGVVNPGGADQKVEVFFDGAVKSLDNNTATLTFNGALEIGGTATFNEDVEALIYDVGIWNEALSNDRIGLLAVGGDVQIGDTNAPVIASLSPTNNATDVPLTADFVATFDKDIVPWTGNVILTNLTDASAVVLPVTNAEITINGAVLTINPGPTLTLGHEYAVLMDATAIRSKAGTYFAGIASTSTWRFTASSADVTPPLLSSLDPANGESSVPVATNLTASFNENVILLPGGTITITNLTDGTAGVITLPDAQVTAAGADVTINPAANLDWGKTYAVLMDGNAVADVYTNAFAGIASTSTWHFTTDAKPYVTALSPTNGASGVNAATDLRVTFSENVALVNGGTIVITNLTAGTATTITLPNSQVTVSGAVVTIDPSADLAVGSQIAVLIGPTAITDTAGNPFDGITSPATWNFTTLNGLNWSLVAYWPLNAGPVGAITNGTLIDDVIDDPSHPATNGTVVGTLASWVNDPTRGIVWSGGSNAYIAVGSTYMNEDFTWAVWAKSIGGDHGVLMGTRSGSYTRLYLSTVSGTYVSFDFAPDVNDDAWHHLAFRRQSDTFSVYVDGVLAGSTTLAAGDNTMALELGGTALFNDPFNGYLSEAALWREALPVWRIQKLAAGGPVIVLPTSIILFR
jgi:hypothetical protein